MAVPADSLKFLPATTEKAAEASQEKVEASPKNPADSLGFRPVMSGKGAEAKKEKGSVEKGNLKGKDEEELVVTNPMRASLIYHFFNIAFVFEIIFFIAHIVIYRRASECWWQALLAAAIVSPLFIAPLYFIPILRDVFVRAYAMAPPDIHNSDLERKLLMSDKAFEKV